MRWIGGGSENEKRLFPKNNHKFEINEILYETLYYDKRIDIP